MGKYVSMFQLWGSFRKISWSRLKVSSCRSKLAIPGMDSIDMLWIKLYIVVWSFNELVMMIAVLSCIVNVRSCSLFLCAFVCVCHVSDYTYVYLIHKFKKDNGYCRWIYTHNYTYEYTYAAHTHIYIILVYIYIYLYIGIYIYLNISKYIYIYMLVYILWSRPPSLYPPWVSEGGDLIWGHIYIYT